MALDFKQKLLQEAAEDFKRGALDDAEKKCLSVLSRDAYQVATMNLLAGILCKKGRHEDALEYMKQVTNLAPTVPEFQVNCGDIFLDLGQPAAADSYYQRAIQLRPAYPRAWFQRGTALERLKQMGEAQKCFERVVQLDPRNFASMFNLMIMSFDEKRVDDHLKWAESILKEMPGNVDAHRHRGMALSSLGRIPESIEELRYSVQAAPHPEIHSILVFNLNYDCSQSPEAVYLEHINWAKTYANPSTQIRSPFPNQRLSNRPLRIGYVSPDFKDHAVSRFFKPVLKNHDRTKIITYGYHAGKIQDGETEWYKSTFSGWRDISSMDDEGAERMIREDEIDILVDLSGHTAMHRLKLFGRGCAPVQVSWLGYPNSTGLSQVDYKISDDVLDPIHAPTPMSETIWRLPNGFTVFDEPMSRMEVSLLPAQNNGYLTFGSFHALQKLNDSVLDLWAEVLHACPNSKLLIFRSALTATSQAELRSRFERRKINDDRLIFEQRRPASGSHLEMYHRIDVHLDSFPWNGHTTTCDALWMGVPTLTLRGDRHSARMSASMLTRLKLESWIAESREDFVAKAVAITRSIEDLAALRASLRERMRASPLMDGPTFTRGLEAAFQGMWQKWIEQQEGA